MRPAWVLCVTRRRLTVAAIASLVMLAIGASTASAADVTVVNARDGQSKTVALGSIGASFDIDANYALVSADGQTRTQTIHGISLRSLLAAVDADPTYGAIDVVRPSGGTVRITRAQIEASGAVPVVYDDGGAATFLRPNYGPTDPNSADIVSSPNLVLRQVDVAPYKVTAKVSKQKAEPGESVHFSASATGGGAGQQLGYTWTFRDGTTATGPTADHRFKKRGTYSVLVTVKGEGESSSSPAVVNVVVGKPVASKKKRPGGGTNDAAAAPLSGQADGSSGDGAEAGSAEKPPKRKKRAGDADPQLTTVTGELLSSTTGPSTTSSLAARSGNGAAAPEQAAGIPEEALGGAALIALLGFGGALELGAFSGLRRRRAA
jgi:PKD repeat protein